MVKLFEDDKFYTTGEVADVVRVRKEAIYKWIKQNRLPALRVGNAVRLRGSDLNEFIRIEGKKAV